MTITGVKPDSVQKLTAEESANVRHVFNQFCGFHTFYDRLSHTSLLCAGASVPYNP
jgi:hypothetical protein